MIEGTLVERNRVLYIKHTIVLYDEPIKRHLYWRVIETKGNPYTADRPAPGDRAMSQGYGQWRCARPSSFNTGTVRIDEKAQAEMIEEEPIPPPKTSLPLQYRDQKWLKQTKKGWVPAV